ncbi:NACHT domain-containing protein [Nonomuraea sp. 10N515B]|uniref:NACHT domain-containing protein n=1 Tax=Nonomuraea sp. 10N515B TaxID=3457422 RepID=UPI003FCECD00
MPNGLSYADAVKLLGGSNTGLVAALDRLTGGVLLAATGGGSEFVLSLFDAKGELARLSGELVSGLGDRLRGFGRFDRTERLTAAHKVIVLTGFFEALSAVTPAELRLDKAAQVTVVGSTQPSSNRLRDLVGVLLDSDIPGEPLKAGEHTMHAVLREFYASLSERLIAYLRETDAWTRLGSVEEMERHLTIDVPDAAIRRYEEHLRRLAGEFPEVAFWANRLHHSATHEQLLRLHAGLEGLGRVLGDIAAGTAVADHRRLALTRRYQRVLDRPILATDDVPEGLAIPSLAAAYVNPSFRAAEVTHASPLDQEQWWDQHPVRDDLQGFLIGYLTSISATCGPLIVLGQPGSGKSVLTQALAARLPAADFLTVRVALRDVPADTDLQSQIEYAIRDETGETLTWPALARTAGGALPVVLLDGFDELLQATGIGQTDYLEQVARFQEREADQGRPAAVIVTSRIAVADRARIPRGGATAIKLEPFSDQQVEQWLTVWNDHNSSSLAARGLRPLPRDAALRQPTLAGQPLLLLMLALYDAADNALQQPGQRLNEADLYERILRRFAEREIHKTRPELAGGPLQDAVEQELLRLSIAGFAMFNRGRQWVTDDELTADLTALLRESPSEHRLADFHAPPTPAQQVISRFFFIHQAQALRKDGGLTTCEFLHATFGEFLVARLTLRELADLAAATAARSRRSVDDGFVRALLSFAPLTTRGQIVDFLTVLTGQFTDDQRRSLRSLLLTIFHGALESPMDTSHDSYQPAQFTLPARHAAYSGNVLLLIAMISGPVTGRELFPRAPYPASSWRRRALLWRSQFSAEAWRNLAAILSLERTWYRNDRDVSIDMAPDQVWSAPELDPYWTFYGSTYAISREWEGWHVVRTQHLLRESHFTGDLGQDIAWHALEAITRELDGVDSEGPDDVEATSAFGVLSPGRALSVTNAITRVWLASSRPTGGDDLQQAYEDCFLVILRSREEGDTVSRNVYLARVLRQLAADRDRLSPDYRADVLDFLSSLNESIVNEPYLARFPVVRRWGEQAFEDVGWPTASE